MSGPDVLKVECCLIDKGYDVFFDELNRRHYFKCRCCGKTYNVNSDDR